MASGAVWGIDIGQCSLKALRCRTHDDPRKFVAEAFDYIEYPKILSQPGSDPVELISEALKQFLSRNTVLGDRVAISVPGQSGLARFIKLPPVESKKIPDIVRYEAKQQIPFDLNDVVWDYQRMGGGSVEEGFALETEVGLFAMKRDAVFRALDPFIKQDIEVDFVQLTPLVLYNFMLFDQMDELPPADEYDPENPPESAVIISMGTDATDLVITNGFRVWQRSIPIGGSHFTKALTRELKLTFAKAEHLKRNATAAADPKAVFQAMRPVFGDLLTELQRSISYFSNLERSAKIGRVVALGNAMKLPGLRRYLAQNLGFEIDKVESYQRLVGPQVVTAPAFQENLLSFGVCYGLALQGLDKSGIRTNLLPREIVNDRLIRRKKPWAVAAAALLALSCGVSFAAYSLPLRSVDPELWKAAASRSQQIVDKSSSLKSEEQTAKTAFLETDKIGQNLVTNVEGRLRWLELLRAINRCLPFEPPLKADEKPLDIPLRNELHVTNIDCQYIEDVSVWYAQAKNWESADPNAEEAKPAAAAAVPQDGAVQPGVVQPDVVQPGDPNAGDPNAAAPSGPSGPGWIVRLSGHHWHNEDRNNQGAQFVRNTLIEELRSATIDLPEGVGGALKPVAMKDLGISHPVLVNPERVYQREVVDPNAEADTALPGGMGPGGMEGGMGMPGGTRPTPLAGGGATGGKTRLLNCFDFNVQFCWQPKTPSERKEAQNKPNAGENPQQL
ncbi:MAG: pilus assembly protein PilM [Pirellulaceae bacterium]|nr:pilus assembly protein PilM [Pirellulaceae bacterium]